jgi:hypothetical protein
MEGIMGNEQAIKVNVYSISVNRYNCIEYPGFTTITADNEETSIETPFVIGAGIIVECGADVRHFFPGQKVAFCGFSKGYPDKRLTTTVNNIALLPKNINFAEATAAGILVPIIAALNRTQVKVGENVLAIGKSYHLAIARQLLGACGCCPFVWDIDGETKTDDLFAKIMKATDNHGVDGIICLARADSFIAAANLHNLCRHPDRITFVTDTGKGFWDEKYMNSQTVYPYAYIRETTTANLEFALRLVAERKVEIEPLVKTVEYQENCFWTASKKIGALFEEPSFVMFSGRENCANDRQADELLFPAEPGLDILTLANLYAARCNPGLLKVTCQCEMIDERTFQLLLLSLVQISGSKVAWRERSGDGKELLSVSVTCAEGSVAVINMVAGFKRSKERFELHWDGMSLSYIRGEDILLYSGGACKNITREAFVEKNYLQAGPNIGNKKKKSKLKQ